MNVGCLGIGYQQFSIQSLESVYLSADQQTLLFDAIPSLPYIDGVVVLATCNRMEIYFEFNQSFEKACSSLIQFIASANDQSLDTVQEVIQASNGLEVFEHLFQVSCGLRSMVFGENEILGQIKKAYQFSCDHHAATKMLHKMFQIAIATGKRSRHETRISTGAYSVSSLAVDYIQHRCADFMTQSILIVGAGTMGVRVIKKLKKLNHPSIFLTNRHMEKCDRVSKTYGIKWVDYSDFIQHQLSFDILILATSSSDYLVVPPQSPSDELPYRFILDLGVPRNADPTVDNMCNVNVITIDGFRNIVDQTLQSRSLETPKVQHIIQEELGHFQDWYTRIAIVNE